MAHSQQCRTMLGSVEQRSRIVGQIDAVYPRRLPERQFHDRCGQIVDRQSLGIVDQERDDRFRPVQQSDFEFLANPVSFAVQ